MDNYSLTGLKVAVTVDDLFQWTGVPFPAGRSPRTVVSSMVDALAAHNVPGVYAFSNTAPIDQDKRLLDVFDAWCAAGHHVGNHTHHHASLNWVDPKAYIKDIDESEALIGEWIDRAPTRYFRYAFDMWGDTSRKTDEIQVHLAKGGYVAAPVSYWFYDAQFMVAYHRALKLGDVEAQRHLRSTLVATAVQQLRNQASAAEAALGRRPALVALIHGTAIGGDTISDILAALAAEGVVFVTLEEAMKDPFNGVPTPLTTRKFRNAAQKWAELTGVPIHDVPPRVLGEVEEVAKISGESYEEVVGGAMRLWGEPFGVTTTPEDFH
ncbi:polysaccharide deacetylase family protein [Nocardia sp. NPDC004750]